MFMWHAKNLPCAKVVKVPRIGHRPKLQPFTDNVDVFKQTSNTSSARENVVHDFYEKGTAGEIH